MRGKGTQVAPAARFAEQPRLQIVPTAKRIRFLPREAGEGTAEQAQPCHPHFPHFWAVRNAFLINGVKIFGAVSFATRLNGLILRAWTEGSPLRAHWRSSCGRSLGRKIWSAAKDFSGRGQARASKHHPSPN